MKSFLSKSGEQTKRIAKDLAENGKFRIIGLTGELGVGKTTFTQGFAQGLGIKEKIISPTFVLIRQHKIPNTNKILNHVDLYRLEDKDDVKHLGLEELMANPNNIVLIEWAEKIEDLLPKETLKIFIESVGENFRKITFSSDLMI